MVWHIPQIKAAIGIGGVLTDEYCWRGNDENNCRVQIDLILDRADRMADICEIKFSDGEYSLEAEEYRKIRNRMDVYRRASHTSKGLRLVMISSGGLKDNFYRGNVQSLVTLDDLFV